MLNFWLNAQGPACSSPMYCCYAAVMFCQIALQRVRRLEPGHKNDRIIKWKGSVMFGSYCKSLTCVFVLLWSCKSFNFSCFYFEVSASVSQWRQRKFIGILYMALTLIKPCFRRLPCGAGDFDEVNKWSLIISLQCIYTHRNWFILFYFALVLMQNESTGYIFILYSYGPFTDRTQWETRDSCGSTEPICIHVWWCEWS